MVKQKTKLYCPTCFLQWETKSTRKFVSCPNCLVKVENKGYIPLQAKPEILYNGKTSKQISNEPKQLGDVQ